MKEKVKMRAHRAKLKTETGILNMMRNSPVDTIHTLCYKLLTLPRSKLMLLLDRVFPHERAWVIKPINILQTIFHLSKRNCSMCNTLFIQKSEQNVTKKSSQREENCKKSNFHQVSAIFCILVIRRILEYVYLIKIQHFYISKLKIIKEIRPE